MYHRSVPQCPFNQQHITTILSPYEERWCNVSKWTWYFVLSIVFIYTVVLSALSALQVVLYCLPAPEVTLPSFLNSAGRPSALSQKLYWNKVSIQNVTCRADILSTVDSWYNQTCMQCSTRTRLFIFTLRSCFWGLYSQYLVFKQLLLQWPKLSAACGWSIGSDKSQLSQS